MKFKHLTILSLAFVLSSNMNAQTNDIISIEEKKYTHPLIIVNGYELRYYEYQKIKPNQIDTMIVLDEIDGVNVFGEKASAGAIVIKLVPLYSRYFNSEAKKIDDLILEKVKRIAEQREEERKQKEEEERIRQEEALRIAEEFKRQEEEKLLKEKEKNQTIEHILEPDLKTDTEVVSIVDEGPNEIDFLLNKEAEQIKLNSLKEEFSYSSQLEAEEKTRLEAEEKALKEAEEKVQLEAEEKARKEAEEKARLEAEEKARKEAEEKSRKEAEEKARKEAATSRFQILPL